MDEARKVGASVTLNTLRGISHFCYPNKIQKEIYNFFKDKSRVETPGEINFKTPELKYGKSYWLEVKQKESNTIASINAKVLSDNKISVQTEHILSYKLNLEDLPIDMSEKLLIQTNGVTSFNEKADSSIVDIALMEDFVSESVYKNPQIEGAISHVFADQFILVRGTIGNEKEQKITAVIWY
jgi:hypothetical protein